MEERLQQIKNQRAPSVPIPGPESDSAPDAFSARLSEWESLLDKRLEEFRAARGEAPLPHFPEQLPLSPGGKPPSGNGRNTWIR